MSDSIVDSRAWQRSTWKLLINAPADICFDLARDIDVHLQTSLETGEKVVDGVTSGKMELGDFVTFEGSHFGVKFRLSDRLHPKKRQFWERAQASEPKLQKKTLRLDPAEQARQGQAPKLKREAAKT